MFLLGGLSWLYAAAPEAENTVLLSRASDASSAQLEDPKNAVWNDVSSVSITHAIDGSAAPGRPTLVQSLWTNRDLYLRFTCPYTKLYVKPGAAIAGETDKLWTWDVAEAFIGAFPDDITRYREFEMSPRGEWVDLDIHKTAQHPTYNVHWTSGFTVRAFIDNPASTWCGVMRVPLKSLTDDGRKPGETLRINFFRASGPEAARELTAWQPTHSNTFHVPQAFGQLRLASGRTQTTGAEH